MLPIIVFVSAIVTSKERCAVIIALHQNALTCKESVVKNIRPERTIYRVIKNLKERGSTAVKRASVRPRVSSTELPVQSRRAAEKLTLP